MSLNSEDYGLELLKQKSDLAGRKWHLTPIMEEMYKKNIAHDQNKLALKYNVNATQKIIDTVDYCVEHDEYVVVECVGVPASGKSLAMISVGRLIQKAWLMQLRKDHKKGKREDFYTPRIYIGSSVEETQRFFKKARKGDTIIQDEDPNLSGSGTDTIKKNIANILEICRESCINFIFVSPSLSDFLGGLVTMRLESISKDYARRITKLAVYTPNNIAIGYGYIRILDEDDKLIIRYLKKKRANIEKIKETGGGFSVGFGDDDREKWAQEVADYLVDKVGMEQAVNLSKGYIKAVCRWKVKGRTVKDQEDIAYDVEFVLNKMYSEYEVVDVVELEEGEFRAIQSESREDKEFLEVILAHFDPSTEHERLGVEWFKHYYIDGLKQIAATEAINENNNTNYDRTSFLNVFFPAVQQNLLGTAVEKAIQEAYYPDTEYVSGNAEPDLKGEDFIVEIKARHIKDKRRPLKLIQDEVYLKDYLNKHYPVKLIIVSYGKQECIIKEYDLLYSKGEDTNDVT